jgi:hypothetical protein
MYDVPFLLNHAIDRHHRRGENNAAPTLEQRRPNHRIDAAGFVFESEKLDALR